MNNRTVLVWFRNDLRIQDNEMLSRVSERGEIIIPVYCFDPRYYTQTKFKTRKTGVVRAKFINESVNELQDYFRLQGGTLLVKVGLPEEVIPELAKKYKVDEVYHHREVAQEETDISSLVEDALWRIKINLRHFIGHTLFHKDDFPFPVRDIPNSFSVFRKKLERESFIRDSFVSANQFVFPEDLEETVVPELSEMGFDEQELSHAHVDKVKGGEQEGQKQLANALQAGKISLGINLSPWIALGCLSVHAVYFSVKESTLPKKVREGILQGLWWKDYYRFMFKKYGNLFFKEKGYTGNPPIVSSDQRTAFEEWKAGKTASGEVNEIMIQLKETGSIDFNSRTVAACYLIHQLQVNWLWGAAYFEEMLVDYNPSSNYGNWAHLAGVGSSLPHNRTCLKGAV